MPARSSSTHRKQRRASSRPRRQRSLLILQLDTEQLQADGLCLIRNAQLAAAISSLGSGAEVAVQETTDERNLLEKLSGLAEQGRRFDVVVCIGHSNENGIKIASDRFVSWDVFAGYLKPFEPRRLLLVACRAGRWPAAQVLFQKLPKLRRIFASPVNASKALGNLMLWAVPYLLEVKSPRDKVVQYGQVAAAVLTGGQIRQWRRTRDKDNPEGVLLDVAAQIFEPHIRQLPEAIRSLIRPASS